MPGRFLSVKTTPAPPIKAGGYTITPISRSVVLDWRWGAATRAWPCAVLVSRGGRTSRRPILNITHLLQAAVLGSALLAAWRLCYQPSHRKETSP